MTRRMRYCLCNSVVWEPRKKITLKKNSSNKLENVPLFFLEFNGDTTNWSSSNTFHQVSDETGDLVSETLGWNNSDLLDDPLVSVEVQGQHHVVFL